MFFEKGQMVRITDADNKEFTGTIYKIVIQPCADDNNRPHGLLFLSDANDGKQDLGCMDTWIDKLKSIVLLEKNVHIISNITSDEIYSKGFKRESDGKMCYLHKLIADRTYEDGTTDVQTTCILSQSEYEQVLEKGQYTFYADAES